MEEEIKKIRIKQKKFEEEIASIKANHFTAIYAILAFLGIKVLGDVNLFESFVVTPEIAFVSTYLVVVTIYYKETIIFAKSILKKGIGLK